MVSRGPRLRLQLLTAVLLLVAGADARTLQLRGVRAASGHGSAAGSVSPRQRDARETPQGVYLVPRLLDDLRTEAAERAHAVARRYQLERERLSAALTLAGNSSDRALVEFALNQSAEDFSEAQVAATEAMEYYYTAKGMLGSQSPAPGCAYLACGEHAKCHEDEAVVVVKGQTMGGARCECEPCYEGDGFRCRPVPCTPATLGSALPVRGAMPAGYPVVPRETPGIAAQVCLIAFDGDRLALVHREVSNANRGALTIGKIDDTEVTWGKKQLLDPNLQTFGLALVVSPGGRLAIGFSDREKGGVGYLMGGHVGTTGDELQAMLSPPEPFAREQHEQLVLVQLESSRVVCLYAETESSADGKTSLSFGGAVLAEVLAGGPMRIWGRYRFAEGQLLTRLAAVALTPTSLVLAYRALLPPGEPAGQHSRELSALWIGMSGSQLVIDPHPIALEPERSEMWARDVALVGENTFAYTFSGKDKVTKTAVIRVDPRTHDMTFLESPVVIDGGVAEYMRSVSLPGSPYIPSTFTILQHAKEPCTAKVCRISPAGRVTDCRDVPWAEQELKDVSASRLLDGRIAVAFIDPSGRVLYQLLGAQEHGAMLDFGK